VAVGVGDQVVADPVGVPVGTPQQVLDMTVAEKTWRGSE
jgi:hypothetical protein